MTMRREVTQDALTAAQVARCMIRLKHARDAASATPDSAVGIAGYAACLCELHSVER